MTPHLTIVVTIVDGALVLQEFLEALTRQGDKHTLEIIVPFDSSVPGIPELQVSFPDVCFLDIGTVRTDRDIHSAAGQHELFDRRRAAGLTAATANLIALLDDRGLPRPDWVQTVLRLHHQLPHAVIGGAIQGRSADILNRAVHTCDYSRYELPFASRPAQWVSDVNISYKRRALDLTHDLWKKRFQEPKVHWELLRQGETLFLCSELIVDHRRPARSLSFLLQERFHWGRLFGAIRAAEWTLLQRTVYTMLGPLIPCILLIRHTRTQIGKGHFGKYLPTIPAVALLLVSWTTGEVWGYVTQKS